MAKFILMGMIFSVSALANFPKPDSLFGTKASSSTFEHYTPPQVPKADSDGKYPTLNKTGLMTHDRDPFSEAYMAYTKDCEEKSKSTVLEIGAAYGITTLPTLKTGATVVANDIESRHLLILRDKTPAKDRERLYLNAQSFPDKTNFPPNSFDAVLVCRVIHLFTPEAAEESLKKIQKWLKPGGRVYITALTPFHHGMRTFLPIYNKRWKEGSLWPGVIENFHHYFPKIKSWSPEYVHIMDDRPLISALERHGFKIVQASFYDYDRPNKSRRTGKEYFGVVAEKR